METTRTAIRLTDWDRLNAPRPATGLDFPTYPEMVTMMNRLVRIYESDRRRDYFMKVGVDGEAPLSMADLDGVVRLERLAAGRDFSSFNRRMLE